MCCFFLVLMFLGPRVGLLVFWLFPYGQAMMRFRLSELVLADCRFGFHALDHVDVRHRLRCRMEWLVLTGSGLVWVWLPILHLIPAGAWKRKEIPGY